MSCHITLYDCRLHMKHPELFIGVRVCHPSTLRWTERVVLCFFCPAGGGRVPWSKVWRCRGPWSIMGFPDYHEMIITFLNITVSSTKQNILDQFFLGRFGFSFLGGCVSETVQHGYETTCQGADQGEADVELLGWEDSRMCISWYFMLFHGISHEE